MVLFNNAVVALLHELVQVADLQFFKAAQFKAKSAVSTVLIEVSRTAVAAKIQEKLVVETQIETPPFRKRYIAAQHVAESLP